MAVIGRWVSTVSPLREISITSEFPQGIPTFEELRAIPAPTESPEDASTAGARSGRLVLSFMNDLLVVLRNYPTFHPDDEPILPPVLPSTPPAYTSQAASVRLQGLASLRQTTPSESSSSNFPSSSSPMPRQYARRSPPSRVRPTDEAGVLEMALADQAENGREEIHDEDRSTEPASLQSGRLGIYARQLREGLLDANGEPLELRNDSGSVDISLSCFIGR